MLKQLKNRKSEGFTIIEVLIVLAIAALILLIVFLAIPALNRNSRNTTLKNDVQAIAGAVSEYSSNNGGSLPPAAAASISGSGTITLTGGGVTVPSTAKVNGSTTVTAVTSAPAFNNNFPKATIQVWFQHDCTGAGSNRATAIYYGVENGNGTTTTCQDS
jgi:prepilin-type N-terminal cleavage/methylation domain-containing protein